MPAEDRTEGGGGTRRLPGWVFVPLLIGFYTACVIAATYPYARSFADSLPAWGDPCQHLWIMRWYRACLLEGRSPLVCPDLQYPVGAPLGNFSPLHAQSLLFLPLSPALKNDALTYNVIWMIGLVTTGLGTYALARHVVGDRACAAMAGLLAMLSGPLMLHAHAHLELTFVGAFPVFLLAWLRFLERPTWGRLAASAVLYVLTAACAAYFLILSAFPAAFAVVWKAAEAGRRGWRSWLRERLPWLVGFVAAIAPACTLLFLGQITAAMGGHSTARPLSEFADHGATLWGYAVPTFLHGLSAVLPCDIYAASGYTGIRGGLIVENASYLGVVTLGLLYYAASRRVGFRGAAFWWSVFALLVVLSLGAYLRIGSQRVGLPSLWLWRIVPGYRSLRSPARFNLLAAVLAAVPAAAGLKHLLGRIPARGARWVVLGILAAVAVADLGMVPYRGYRVAAMPACYEAIRKLDPEATLLELPVQRSSFDLSDLDRTYWQSRHRLKTSAGYSGIANARFDRMIFDVSPFPTWRPDFLEHPDSEVFGPLAPTAFRDYAWAFLKAHDYRYVVVHRWRTSAFGTPEMLERVKAELREAKVYEDDEAAVYDRERMAPPTRPVLLCGEGWMSSLGYPWPIRYAAEEVGRLFVYNPDPGRGLVLTLEAASLRAPRRVRLRSGTVELASWQVRPDEPATYRTPPFTLPRGLHELTLESDGEDRPRSREALDEAKTPYSLRVVALGLKPASDGDGPPVNVASQTRSRR